MGPEGMDYTAGLCRWISRLSLEDLGTDTPREVRRRTADWLGCAVGARDASPAAAARDLAEELGGKAACTLLGAGERTSVLNAVFSNAVMGHALECDDVDKPSISHPGAVAVPAALAAAELAAADFGRCALGIVAGYEVMIRLGTALNPSLYDHWHTTGACGAFAAAAAAGKVLNLTAPELERGMGLAAMMASGLVCGFGSDAKLVNVGHGAAAGVLAALLAQRGYSAPEAVWERGYGAAVSRSVDLEPLLPQPGDPLMITESYYKIHASCGHTHTGLDAFLSLRREYGFQAEEIESVTLRVYRKAAELVGTFRNETEAQAKFSLPYCVSAAAVLGSVSLESFREDARALPRILELGRRVHVEEEPLFTKSYPRTRPERVLVALRDGRVLSRTVELPEGKAPDAAFLREKFLRLCGRSIPAERAGALYDAVLGAASETGVRELMDYVRKETCFGKQYD